MYKSQYKLETLARKRAAAELAAINKQIKQEVSRRKRIEKQLEKSQKSIFTLMSNLPGMAYRCRNDKNRTMEFVSEGCIALTGYASSALFMNRKISYSRLIHPEDKESVRKETQDAIRKNRHFRLTYRIKSSDGEEKYVWDQGCGIRSSGGKAVVLEGFIADISERKRLEEKLQKAQDRLEIRVRERTAELRKTQQQLIQSEKLNAMGRLASGVAHEINNPLNVISGNAEALSMENQDKEVKRVTKVIMEQAQRVATIIDRLLQFSRRAEPTMKPVDINKILEETLSLLGYQVKPQNIKVIKKFCPSLPEITADFIQLQQVFLNIMLNAVQAMPKGGELVIRTYAKKITELGRRKSDVFKQGSKIVVIEVEDTGRGIPEGKLEIIFDPFFSTKEQGTGLGLSICHGIIEAHRGAIDVQSKPGKGTAFIVKLPVQK